MQHLNPSSVSRSDWKNVIRAAQLAFVTTMTSVFDMHTKLRWVLNSSQQHQCHPNP